MNFVEKALVSKSFSHLKESFIQEKNELLRKYIPGCYLFVHTNLTRDNVIVGRNEEFYVTGFTRSRIAPMEYEMPNIIFDLLGLDRGYLRGFYRDYDSFELTEKALIGALMHENGSEILTKALGDISYIDHVNQLRDIIFKKIKK